MAKTTRKKRRKGGLAAWLRKHRVAAAVIAVCILLAGWLLWQLGRSTYWGEPRWVYIPKHASSAQITDSLRGALGDGMATNVMRLWSLQGGDAKTAHGAYLIDHGANALTVSRCLKSGRQTPVKVSFNNVRTLEQLAEKVTVNLEASPQDFRNACRAVLPALGYETEEQYPAAFIPDTYEFYWTVDARELVNKLEGQTEKFWTDERRAQAEKLGLTPVGVAIIASIVEKESAKADERPKIARLYINRLQKGMRLQADPTVIFAIGDFSIRRLTGAHLKYQSPYNTYLVSGLPPGPIDVPERRTLLDVLEAPEHPYIYMCAKEDFSGYHNFASDYATHRANARRYQSALDRRGIK